MERKKKDDTGLESHIPECRHNIIGNVIGSSGVIARDISGNVTVYHGGSCTQKDAVKESESYQAICRKVENYVRTDLYKEALNDLNNKNELLLLAGAGDGKSTLLKQLALELAKSHFLTIKINSPQEIKNYDITDKRVLFVCDNLLGETRIDEDKANVWRKSVREDFDTSGEDVKFLFACRLDLWGRFKSDLESKYIFENTVDVRSTKLSYDDKLNMLKQYLQSKVSVTVMEKIAKKSTLSFPECCRFVAQRGDGIDFSNTEQLVKLFSHPFQFVVKQLKTVQFNHQDQYTALLLCLLNDRKLLRINPNRTLKEPKFREIFERFCTREQSLDKLLDAADQLNGSLLTQEGDSYDFYHDSICEAMCRVHGERYPVDILTYCKPEVVFSVFQVCGSDPNRVTLTPCSYEKLLEIVTKKCVEGLSFAYVETWKFVFEELNRADILVQWCKRLLKCQSAVNQQSTVTSVRLFDCLLLITQLPGSSLTVDNCFMTAARYGDTETSQLLMDSGMTRHGRREGLGSAARGGYIETVRMIAQRGDLDMQDIEWGLLIAVDYDRVECVREILRLLHDINAYTIKIVFEEAVRSGHIQCVRELLKHPSISRRKVLTLLDECDRELFSRSTSQTDRDEIRRLLHTYLDSLSSDVDRRAVELWRAAGEGQVETLTRILRQTTLDREDIELGLERAVFCNRVESVKVFLTLELNTDTIQGVLIWAVECNNVKCLCELLKRDIDTGTMRRVLERAVRCNRSECLCEILKRGIDTDTIHRLLERAVKCNSVGCLCEMLKRGTDTDTIRSLLQEAVRSGHIQCVRELLKHPSISRRKVQTLLDECDRELFSRSTSQTDRDEIRRLLHTYLNSLSSDVDRRAVELWRAAGEGQVETLTHILRQTDLDREDIELGLERAVFCNRVESVKVFLMLALNTDTIQRVLKRAVRCNSVECLCELSKRDIDSEIMPRVLEEAVIFGRVQCVRELLKHPSISRRMVQTMDKPDWKVFGLLTSKYDHDEIRRLLHAYLDSLTSDVDRWAVELWRAAGKGQVETLTHILQQTHLDREDIELGLKRAVFFNRVESVKVFLTLELNSETIYNLLQTAVEYGRVKCVRELLKSPSISRQKVAILLNSPLRDLFFSPQNHRHEAVELLRQYINTES